MKQNAGLRKIMAPLERTPLHPQWLVFRKSRRALRSIGEKCRGTVLDIGAGARRVESLIPPDCSYISLDYMETAVDWYETRPHVFGDGQFLPFKDDTIDTVLLLDVLEHLPKPDKALAEARRVLRPGGSLHISVPFLYPLHDSPYDFQRWTSHGMKQLAVRHGFAIKGESTSGHALETAALLSNLALASTVLHWFRSRNPLVLISPLLLAAVPASNITAWLLAKLSGRDDGFMAFSCQCTWNKPK